MFTKSACILVILAYVANQSQAACDGECKPINECKPILDLIKNAPKPLNEATKAKLRSYHCGTAGTSVKVCCKTEEFNDDADLSNHPNLALLPQTECGLSQLEQKIVNGNLTSLFEFPWMALLSYRTNEGLQFLCGGTVINERYILTAAHCISNLGSKKLVGVRLGEYDIGTKRDCHTYEDGEKVCAPAPKDFRIGGITPHAGYSIVKRQGDIGLIRLDDEIVMSESIRPICLPIEKNVRNLNLKSDVVVTGWGKTEHGNRSNILLKATIPIVTQSTCLSGYKNRVALANTQLCAGDIADACRGDSGGPLQVQANVNADSRYVQYGVVSYGPDPCGVAGYPGIYTYVPPYLKWILDTIRA